MVGSEGMKEIPLQGVGSLDLSRSFYIKLLVFVCVCGLRTNTHLLRMLGKNSTAQVQKLKKIFLIQSLAV